MKRLAVPGGEQQRELVPAVIMIMARSTSRARDPRFLEQVDIWARSGVVAQWHPRMRVIDANGRRPMAEQQPRWVGTPGMSSLASSLLIDIELRCSERVLRVERNCAGLVAANAHTLAGPYAALLCTLPAPQAAELLSGEAMAKIAATVPFAPCWAVLVEFDAPLEVDFDAAFVNCGPLSLAGTRL